jgi:hypothetical protein
MIPLSILKGSASPGAQETRPVEEPRQTADSGAASIAWSKVLEAFGPAFGAMPNRCIGRSRSRLLVPQSASVWG